MRKYANVITCIEICDNDMKGLGLSFNLLQILAIYGYKQLRYNWSCMYTPNRESHVLCFHKYLWIYKVDNLHMQQGDNRPKSKPPFGTKFSCLGKVKAEIRVIL